MSNNFSLDCKEFDFYLVDTYEDSYDGQNGAHYLFRFDNGYGASVIKTFYSCGYYDDLWELAVIKFTDNMKKGSLGPGDYEIIYDNSIMDGRCVMGWLTDEEVRYILHKIKSIKKSRLKRIL